MNIIENQLYKITYYYERSEFVEAEKVEEIARYVGQRVRAGKSVSSVTEINLDGTHPRVAISKMKAYKEAVKGNFIVY